MRDFKYKFAFMNHMWEGKGSSKVVKIVCYVILGIIGITVLALIFGIFVKWLWNALMPVIFGLPEIGFWQAVGLVVLGHIFFGGDHSHHYERSGSKRKKKEIETDEKSPFQLEIEHDYAEFWREEGHEAFKNWMHEENSTDLEES
jgi:hypothetical protein